MPTFEEMSPFLKAVSYLDTHPRRPKSAPERAPFITISREAGADAHGLANALLVEMKKEPSPLFQNWRIYDRELCEELVRQPDIHFPLDALAKESFRTELEDTIITFLGGGSPQCLVVEKMFQAIRSLASAGRAIIIGRGGCCLTSSFPLGLHVRLIAPEPHRIARVQRTAKLSQKEAARYARLQEADRAKLVKAFFNRDISDPLLYDSIWNTERVPMPAIARAIVECLKARFLARGQEVSAVRLQPLAL